jgi:hypothetical protein
VRIAVFSVSVLFVLAGCGGNGTSTQSDFDGTCEISGGTIVTAMNSCEDALTEGREILEDAGMVIESAPESGSRSVLLATCYVNQLGSSVETPSWIEAAAALDEQVCPIALSTAD